MEPPEGRGRADRRGEEEDESYYAAGRGRLCSHFPAPPNLFQSILWALSPRGLFIRNQTAGPKKSRDVARYPSVLRIIGKIIN